MRLLCEFRISNQPILPAQAKKMSSIAKIWTAIVRQKATYKYTTQILLSYTRALEEAYDVRFIEGPVLNIVKNTMFSNFFAANSKATYITFITVHRKLVKHQDVVLLPEKLERHPTVLKTPAIMPLNGPSL